MKTSHHDLWSFGIGFATVWSEATDWILKFLFAVAVTLAARYLGRLLDQWGKK